MEIGLSLGSNKGDRLSCLQSAIDRIRKLDRVSLLEQSVVYETEPVGVPCGNGNDKFLNCVVLIKTEMAPDRLLEQLQSIEIDMGRPADHVPGSPRTLDIDIIYSGTVALDTPDLTIPHPRWQERRFVVEPLAELRPGLVLPGTDKPVKDILKLLPPTPRIWKLET